MADEPLSPASLLKRLPPPALDIEGENPLDEPQRMEVRRSVLAIAELDHASEIGLVRRIVAARERSARAATSDAGDRHD